MDLTPERVEEIIKISQEPVSLQTPIGEEEDSHLGDFIEDQSAPRPRTRRLSNSLKSRLATFSTLLRTASAASSNSALDWKTVAAAPLKRLARSLELLESESGRLKPRPCVSYAIPPGHAGLKTSSNSISRLSTG